VCAPSACADVCAELCSALDGGAGFDGGVFGGGACETCVTALLQSPDACLTAALLKCDKDPDCKALVTCEGTCATP